MKKFNALRHIDTGTHTLATIRAELQRHGYQTQLRHPLCGMRYLRFCGQFEDLSEISGLIDLASWANSALPTLNGIDWLSVEDQVLHPLIAEHPLELVLSHQHAPFTQISALELITNVDPEHEFSTLEALPGTIMVESFTSHLASDASEITTLNHLQIPLTFSVGYSMLPLSALADINVGDVLLIEHMEGRVSTNGTTLFMSELNQEAIMILNRTDSDNEQHDTFNTPSTENATGLNALPIELSVVLMEKMVPLAQFKTITPGEIIELPPEAILNVKILANQRLFAGGELIQLPNGQLGVEIRTLWPQE